MPKIKNWSKKTYSGMGNGMQWENDPTGKTVVVDYSYGSWTVNINGKKRDFDKKEDARDYAVKWMKDNPKAGKKSTKYNRGRANLGR